jgi:ABC-2 type transport system permease protein
VSTAVITEPVPSPSLGRAIYSIARRELRKALREPASLIPAVTIPLFFYFVQTAALSGLTDQAGFPNYEAFVLPASVLFATANEGAGLSLVMDIDRGYFDKMLLAPVHRVSLVLGAMSANVVRVGAQAAIVTFIAMAAGLDFETGVLGAFGMIGLGVLWGIAFAGFGIAIALKTGSPSATQASFVLFFPFLFMTTTFAPKEVLAGWFKVAVSLNPVTYLLEAMRGFSLSGDFSDIGKGLLAVGGLGVISMTLALGALRSRAS